MENKTLDIVNIIEKTPSNFITDSYKCKMIEKINKNFTTKEQQLFIASFYCYLNYNSKTEFIIDFETVWRWCGFTRKDNAKRLLQKKFEKDIDYIVINSPQNIKEMEKPAPLLGGAGFDEENVTKNSEIKPVNYETMNKKSLMEICKNKNIKISGSKDEIRKRIIDYNNTSVFHTEIKKLGGAGLNKEQIMLTVNTFKKFCLKSETKKADEIHEYYIKLENFLQEIILEENKELEYKKRELEGKTISLKLEQSVSQNLIKELNKKLERKQKARYDLTNCVYIISNILFKGYFKIGKSSAFNNRLNSYTSGAPIEYNVDYLCKVRNKSEETAIENMVLQILGKYRVKNNMDQDREWLYGVDLKTIKKEMNNCIKFMNERRKKYEDISDEDDNKEENDSIDNENTDNENIDDEKDDNLSINKDYDNVNEDYKSVNKDDENNNSEPEIDNQKNKKENNKYEISDSEIRDKNNPADFKKFILECCEINDDFHVIQSDLKLAYKIWCRTPLDSDKTFMKFMDTNYKDTRIFIDNQRRHVFKGLKLKPLIYVKSKYNLDFEEFIEKKCKIDYLYKISYVDFIHFFTEWKQKTEPTFTLNKYEQMNIKKILESFFCRGRVLSSVQSKTKNLVGVLGLGLQENNYGIVEKKRQNKIVKEYDVNTNEVIKEYDSIISCAKQLNIPFSTFSNYVRNQTVINEKYYEI
jgi:hypothetical protein